MCQKRLAAGLHQTIWWSLQRMLAPILHRVSKNVPPLACYNDTRTDFDIFGRNATDEVSSQRRFTMPPQITCFFSALPGKTRDTKIAFSTLCISALPEFNQSLRDFFSLFDSRLILTLLYDSLNHVINAFSLGHLGAWFRRKRSRERCSSWYYCVARTKHQCAVFWVSSFAR